MTRTLVVLGLATLTGVAIASCRPGGGGMQMGAPKYEVIRTDDRPPSELDPQLHVVLPPVTSGSESTSTAVSASAEPIGTTVLTGPTSSASMHVHEAPSSSMSASASASTKVAPKPKASTTAKPPPAASPKPMPPMGPMPMGSMKM